MISSSRQSITQKVSVFFFFFFPLLSYLVCSQIWRNYFLDNCNFHYITKSLKKNPEDIRNCFFPRKSEQVFRLVALHLRLYRNWALPDTLLMKDDFETRSEQEGRGLQRAKSNGGVTLNLNVAIGREGSQKNKR